jgi:hypothetical protein
MKKLIFTVAVAICFSTGVMAQGISGGIKAGLNFANQKIDAGSFSASPDGRTSFHAGVFAIIKLGTLGLQPEILYNSVGADFGGDDVSKIDYVSVPILVRFNFAKIVNIHVGPQFGMLLSAKSDGEDFKDELKSTDLGIAAGVGLDLPMGLIVSARYVVGVSDINDAGGDYKLKNNVMQLSVGYKLFGK